MAAKTGTTDKSYDRWLCGFTPYYAAACWFGYDKSEEVTGFGTNPAGQIWDEVMTAIHKGLEKASFVKPSGLVVASQQLVVAIPTKKFLLLIICQENVKDMVYRQSVLKQGCLQQNFVHNMCQ